MKSSIDCDAVYNVGEFLEIGIDSSSEPKVKNIRFFDEAMSDEQIKAEFRDGR